MKNLRLHLLTLAALPMCSATAAPVLWDGSDSAAWSLGANWSTNLEPLTTDIAVFSQASYAFQPDAETASVAGIEVGDGTTASAPLTLSGTSLTLGAGGITMKANAGAATISAPVSLGANQTWQNASGNLLTVSGAISGTGLVTKSGAGTLALTGASTVNGQLIVNGGSTVFDGATWSAPTAAASRNFNVGSGASVEIKNNSQVTLSGWTGLGYVNNTGSGTLTLTSGSLTVNGISGGNPSNRGMVIGEYTGTTGTFHMNGGTLELGNASAAVYVGQIGTGIWNMNGGTATVRQIAFSGSSGTLNLTGGTLIATTLNRSGGTATVNFDGGTLKARAASATFMQGLTSANVKEGGATIDTNGFDITIGQALLHGGTAATDGGITKTGAGKLTLGGTSTYTGSTTINGGTLNLSGTLNSSPISVNNGGTLNLASTLNSSAVSVNSGGTVNLTASAAASPIVVKSGGKFDAGGAGRNVTALTLEDGSVLSAPLDPFNSYLGVDNALTLTGGTVTLVPTFSEAPSIGTYDYIVATGGITGTAALAADFATAGSSRVNGSAQVVGNSVQVTITSLGAALAWNNQTGTGIWDLNTNANFLNGAANDVFKQYDAITFGPTSPSGIVTLAGELRPTSVTVNSSDDFTFAGSGSIAGAANLTKEGSGTLTIANANTFTGDTLVNDGNLTVTGSLTGSNVIIASGATLNGTGAISGSVAVEGTVSPGASVGTLALATGPVILSGTYACDLDGATADKLAVTGNLDLTDATLTLNILSAPTASYYVIATYTGSVFGNFASVPAGYIVDTTEAGKVTLRPTPAAPPAGMITFETDQGYPAAGEVAGVSTDPNGAPFSGIDGWSLAGAAGKTHTTGSSGEYLGGQSIGCSNTGTFTSGRMGGIQRTGAATLVFDAPFISGGTAVGFMKDTDHDGLFDTGHPSGGVPGSGMSFGIGGSPARFQYRDAGFGAEHPAPVLTGTSGHWYRYSITIGESVGGSRSITWAMRNLTTGTDFDFNTATPEIDNWTFSVTDAQFGSAPERCDGVWVRATSASRIDNIRATSAEPPPGTAYDAWIDSFPSLAGADRLPDADPDHDGVENLLEFVLNGNPTTSDPAILPSSSVSGGNLIFTFRRRDDSEGLVNQTVQYGDNLATWTDVVIGATDGSSGGATYTVAENADSSDLITVTIPTGASSKKFVRLLVEEAP